MWPQWETKERLRVSTMSVILIGLRETVTHPKRGPQRRMPREQPQPTRWEIEQGPMGVFTGGRGGVQKKSVRGFYWCTWMSLSYSYGRVGRRTCGRGPPHLTEVPSHLGGALTVQWWKCWGSRKVWNLKVIRQVFNYISVYKIILESKCCLLRINYRLSRFLMLPFTKMAS